MVQTDKIIEPMEVPEHIAKAVMEAAPDKKITCPKARNLADELGVSYDYIGKVFDQLEVHIHACPLGCFK